MNVSSEKLLLKFRVKDTPFGITRGTLKALAEELGVSESKVVHMALSKFAADVLPAYAPDDGPLTVKQIKALRNDASNRLPKGKTISMNTLFS